MSQAQLNHWFWTQVRCRCGFAVALLMTVVTVNLLAAEQFTVESTRAAAEKGNRKALYRLGKRYAKGEGVPQDYGRAAELLRESAGMGYAPAQNDLGAFYAKGLGVKQDYAEAAKWYRKAADKGDALARYSLGRAYWLGRGVATNTPESLKWLKKSAKQNQADAMQFLGEIYLNGGAGTKPDGRRAFHWFLEAAGQGRAGALYSLGQLFEEENGVPRNLHLAINCYVKAAENGDAQAMMRLSELYMPSSQGEGDMVEACKWLHLASRNRYGNSNHLLNLLAQNGSLTAQQYDEASCRADDFERAFGKKPGRR
jgi:uncharacterized protein